MNIYLDTNVYSYLHEAGEARQARDYFRDIAANILVDFTVIVETARGGSSRLLRAARAGRYGSPVRPQKPSEPTAGHS